MPAATNILKLNTAAAEAAPTAAPGSAEAFAALLAGGALPVDGVEGEGALPGETVAVETDEDSDIDAAALLPLLDQLRMAQPVVVPAPVTAVETAPVGEAKIETVASPAVGPAVVPEPAAKDPAVQAKSPTFEQPVAGVATPNPDSRAAKPAIDKAEPVPQPLGTAPGAAPAATEAAARPAKAIARSEPVALPDEQQVAPLAAALASVVDQVAKPIRRAGEVTAQISEAATKALAKAESVVSSIIASPVPEVSAPQLGAFTQQFSAAIGQPVGQPQANIAAALTQQVLDLAKGGEWIDELARDISKAASSDGSMRFRLSPETLGELRVEISRGEQGAHVRMHVSSEAAQQALTEAQPKLVAEARSQGVRIAETEISFTGGQNQSQGRDADRRQQAQTETPFRTARGRTGAAESTSAAAASRPSDRFA